MLSNRINLLWKAVLCLAVLGKIRNFAPSIRKTMYEYRGLQDVFFLMLYGGVAFLAVVACLYLLLRRGNAFVGGELPPGQKPVRLGLEVRSSRRLRRWTF